MNFIILKSENKIHPFAQFVSERLPLNHPNITPIPTFDSDFSKLEIILKAAGVGLKMQSTKGQSLMH